MKCYEANLFDMNRRKVHYITLTDSKTVIGISEKNVIDIKYHTPCGEGDKHFADVYYSDGTAVRLFNIERVSFCVEEDDKEKEISIPF